MKFLPDMIAPVPKNRRVILNYLFAIAALTVIALAVDLDAVWDALSSANIWWWLAAVGATAMAFTVTTWKWKILIAGRGLHVRLKQLLVFNLIATLYSTVLPGQIAGEGVKVVRLVRNSNEGGIFAASVVLDRVTGLLGILILGMAGVVASDKAPGGARTVIGSGIGIALLATLMIYLGLGAILRWVDRRGDKPPQANDAPGVDEKFQGRWRLLLAKIRAGIWKLSLAVHEYHKAPGAVMVAVVLSIVVQLLLSISLVFVGLSLGIDIKPADAAWIFALVSILQLAPITVAGLGTRELGFVGMFGVVGVSSDDAIALSFAFFSVNLVFVLLGAIAEIAAKREVDASRTGPSPSAD
jgi:uncharacterized protein (TIRG00374 family)